jgi:4,5-DOPA dioxygenase extradiol
MKKLPVLFVSHGSPMLALDDSPARRFLLELGKAMPKPQAILMISAHWETTGGPAVSLAATPETIHDFGGFPQALFDIQYPAPGAPEMAVQAAKLMADAGFQVKQSLARGLDHGAWVPLSLMYPAADIPVAQVSLMRGAGAAEHMRLGAALQPLRELGVLIIGSGSLTHNLAEVWGNAQEAPPPAWVMQFEDWLAGNLEQGDIQALLDYRKRAPFAARNHPSEEHLLPLFVALGAGGATAAKRIHRSHTYGVLAMDAYCFGSVGV